MSDIGRRIAEFLEGLPAPEYCQDESALAREIQAIIAEVIPRKRMASLTAGLDAKFAELHASHSDTMAYLGWAEIVALRSDQFQVSDLPEIDALLAELIRQASSHAEIRAHQAQTRAEERARIERLVAIEVQIDSAVDRLRALCRRSPGETAPPDRSPVSGNLQDVLIGPEPNRSARQFSIDDETPVALNARDNELSGSSPVTEKSHLRTSVALPEALPTCGQHDTADLPENEEKGANCSVLPAQFVVSEGSLGESTESHLREQLLLAVDSASEKSGHEEGIAHELASKGVDGPIPQAPPDGTHADPARGLTVPVDAGTGASSVLVGPIEEAGPVASVQASLVDVAANSVAELAEAFDSALASDDLPLAAWIARCSRSLSRDCLPPDWLIEAVIAGRTLDAEGDEAVALAERSSEYLAETVEAEPCPRCRRKGWKVESSERDATFGDLGGLRRLYKCEFCEFSESILVTPRK